MLFRHAVILTLAASCASCDSLEHDRGGFQLPVPKFSNSLKPKTYDLTDPHQLYSLSSRLTEKRALFIGELHDQPEHHLNQLRLIQSLHQQYPYIAIGVEYFQQPFQKHLDDFIAGYIDEREMLVRTEYFKRWNMDYRMLQPILLFAREAHIPMLALNVSDDIHNKVFMAGLSSLSAQERTQIPDDIQPASRDYQHRLKAIYDTHPEGTSFDNFVDGQLLWDEAMADTAAKYLKKHPQTLLVVLSGLGHMMYGEGIPKSLNRRLGGHYSAVAINGNQFGEHPGIADFILAAPSGKALPKAGKLGIMIKDVGSQVVITEFFSGSAAREAGIEVDDRIVALNDVKVASVSEMKAHMFDKQPDERLLVTVSRKSLLSAEREFRFEVMLR